MESATIAVANSTHTLANSSGSSSDSKGSNHCELWIVVSAVCAVISAVLICHHYLLFDNLRGFQRLFKPANVCETLRGGTCTHEVFVLLFTACAGVAAWLAVKDGPCKPLEA